MKIALVNLCKVEDFSKTKYYQDSLDFLYENGIDFVDYFSGRDNLDTLLNGFHRAISDNTVELVWFIQGGNELIKFLNKINWNLVKQSNKKYLGLSDFTHFAFKAVELGEVCYYGQGLKKVKTYLPTIEERQFLVDFLKQKEAPGYGTQLLYGDKRLDLSREKIIGGHSFITAVMLPGAKIDLSDRFLFFEHHYIPGESLSDAEYFLEMVKLSIRDNLPKGFILGHSILFESNGTPTDIKLINDHFVKNLTEFARPIYYIDHFKTIIKFS